MSVLTEIVAGVRADLRERMAEVSPEVLRRRAESRDARMTPEAVGAALRGAHGVRLIAEVKRISPARGLLAAIGRPGALAAEYAAGGAAAISVLTEPRHFGGSLDDLRAVRAAVDIPLLRKDFVVHPYQLAEAAAAGADLVLLIVAALSRPELEMLVRQAGEYGLAVLVETHTEEEVDRALAAGARIIGVNARDLASLRVDRDVYAGLAARIPGDVVTVAESGVRGPADVRAYAQAGADAVLVGSALVTDARPTDAVAAMLAAGRREGLT
ncbi:indole-3-glycerol phosphate synthase TrpC [Streptomyces sp. ISL-94]|uniref:indole-3-glycerol phosphate synthase TrpC n=1 Tax=Streptomyces sp. ISL-94 TaxID=2819190 RepID=UPI001BEB7CCD|nr:indole-3-glycerol phosphate synthase TrpC [Streptomyces sp. ISL-94]MBT2480412.1 indole-3-glycerol phosphate synthase TrpC [Streptomyces sp. ISL-94]